MKNIDTSGWKLVGETSNTRYFEIEPDLLGALPHAGAVDDLKSAQENMRFQNEYWHKLGRGGVVIVFFDNMISQDKDARKVYQQEADPTALLATALVGGSMLSRAMGSFFLGLSKPRTPLKMFPDLEEAKVWARERIRAAR